VGSGVAVGCAKRAVHAGPSLCGAQTNHVSGTGCPSGILAHWCAPSLLRHWTWTPVLQHWVRTEHVFLSKNTRTASGMQNFFSKV